MATHVAFLHDEPLDEIMAGRKRFEFRLSFRGLACRSAREGDRLLLWSDVDLDDGALRISRQLHRMRCVGDEPGTLEFSEPKNASRRTVVLPQRALDALRSHRKRQAEEKLRVGAGWRDLGLVFVTSKGTPVDAQNVVNRHFKPLLRHAGLPDIRWHDLRHTYATLLLACGTHPTFVQKSLGHASVQLTLDRYSHWMPSMGRNTASAIDAALDGTTETRSPGEAPTTKEAGA